MPHRILTEIKLPDFRERPKKEGDILRTAADLFMQFGYNKVTVEEICREANVSKVTFYKYFNNKFAVLETYINARLDLGMEVFERIRNADASLEEKMRALIAMKSSAVNQFSPVFMQSLLSSDPEIQALLSAWSTMSMTAMKQFFIDGQTSGEIHRGYSVDFLLHVWTLLGNDALSPEVQQIFDGDITRMSRDILNFLFYGTSGPPHSDTD